MRGHSDFASASILNKRLSLSPTVEVLSKFNFLIQLLFFCFIQRPVVIQTDGRYNDCQWYNCFY